MKVFHLLEKLSLSSVCLHAIQYDGLAFSWSAVILPDPIERISGLCGLETLLQIE